MGTGGGASVEASPPSAGTSGGSLTCIRAISPVTTVAVGLSPASVGQLSRSTLSSSGVTARFPSEAAASAASAPSVHSSPSGGRFSSSEELEASGCPSTSRSWDRHNASWASRFLMECSRVRIAVFRELSLNSRSLHSLR